MARQRYPDQMLLPPSSTSALEGMLSRVMLVSPATCEELLRCLEVWTLGGSILFI